MVIGFEPFSRTSTSSAAMFLACVLDDGDVVAGQFARGTPDGGRPTGDEYLRDVLVAGVREDVPAGRVDGVVLPGG